MLCQNTHLVNDFLQRELISLNTKGVYELRMDKYIKNNYLLSNQTLRTIHVYICTDLKLKLKFYFHIYKHMNLY